MELENNSSLNFLDLNITKTDGKLEYLFNLPTRTDTVIHNITN